MGGESDPEHQSQSSFDPEVTQSDSKQLRGLAGEVSAVVIPGTKYLLYEYFCYLCCF